MRKEEKAIKRLYINDFGDFGGDNKINFTAGKTAWYKILVQQHSNLDFIVDCICDSIDRYNEYMEQDRDIIYRYNNYLDDGDIRRYIEAKEDLVYCRDALEDMYNDITNALYDLYNLSYKARLLGFRNIAYQAHKLAKWIDETYGIDEYIR